MVLHAVHIYCQQGVVLCHVMTGIQTATYSGWLRMLLHVVHTYWYAPSVAAYAMGHAEHVAIATILWYVVSGQQVMASIPMM